MTTVERLPIPRVNFGDRAQKAKHDQIVRLATSLLGGAELGGPEDMEIETLLRELWGLSGDDGVYVAKELSRLPLFGRLAQMASDEEVVTGRARQRRRARSVIPIIPED